MRRHTPVGPLHQGAALTKGDDRLELYLLRDGSQSPLRLGQFVQIRAAQRSAHFTTYFYNRTEGRSVRMLSYQYGPESELQDDVERMLGDFGGLADL